MPIHPEQLRSLGAWRAEQEERARLSQAVARTVARAGRLQSVLNATGGEPDYAQLDRDLRRLERAMQEARAALGGARDIRQFRIEQRGPDATDVR